jgi:hypothetical protein
LARCCGGTGNLNLNFKLGHYNMKRKLIKLSKIIIVILLECYQNHLN